MEPTNATLLLPNGHHPFDAVPFFESASLDDAADALTRTEFDGTLADRVVHACGLDDTIARPIGVGYTVVLDERALAPALLAMPHLAPLRVALEMPDGIMSWFKIGDARVCVVWQRPDSLPDDAAGVAQVQTTANWGTQGPPPEWEGVESFLCALAAHDGVHDDAIVERALDDAMAAILQHLD